MNRSIFFSFVTTLVFSFSLLSVIRQVDVIEMPNQKGEMVRILSVGDIIEKENSETDRFDKQLMDACMDESFEDPNPTLMVMNINRNMHKKIEVAIQSYHQNGKPYERTLYYHVPWMATNFENQTKRSATMKFHFADPTTPSMNCFLHLRENLQVNPKTGFVGVLQNRDEKIATIGDISTDIKFAMETLSGLISQFDKKSKDRKFLDRLMVEAKKNYANVEPFYEKHANSPYMGPFFSGYAQYAYSLTPPGGSEEQFLQSLGQQMKKYVAECEAPIVNLYRSLARLGMFVHVLQGLEKYCNIIVFGGYNHANALRDGLTNEFGAKTVDGFSVVGSYPMAPIAMWGRLLEDERNMANPRFKHMIQHAFDKNPQIDNVTKQLEKLQVDKKSDCTLTAQEREEDLEDEALREALKFDKESKGEEEKGPNWCMVS